MSSTTNVQKDNDTVEEGWPWGPRSQRISISFSFEIHRECLRHFVFKGFHSLRCACWVSNLSLIGDSTESWDSSLSCYQRCQFLQR